MKKTIYFLYQWFVYIPLLIIITAIVSTIVILWSVVYPPSGTYYSVILWGKILCYATLSRVTVKGREHLRKDQSYIFVANHQGAFDIFLIYGFLHRNFRWIMKKEIRNILLVGRACVGAGHIFIDRTSNHSIAESMNRARRSLQGGISIVVFPEGSRTRTGKVGVFKRGAYQLAIDLQIPIVPITIDGCYEALPRDSSVLSPSHFTLTIHPPVETNNQTHADIPELIKQTRETIISALPQEHG